MANIVNKALDLKAVAALIEDHQGEETVILDVTEDCLFADYFIITTAHSSRHAFSLISYLRDFLSSRGVPMLNKVKSSDQSGWLLLDCGTCLIHVMDKTARSFYELEKLWFRAKPIVYSSKSS
jgi:ribosome-associated protein